MTCEWGRKAGPEVKRGKGTSIHGPHLAKAPVMDPALLEAWIRRRLTRDANTCLLLSPLAILGGILTLFFTFWFSYAVIWMVLEALLSIPELFAGVHWKVGHRGRLGMTAVFLVLLFVSYLKSDRWQRQDLSAFSDGPSPAGQTLGRFSGSRAGLLLAYPGTSSRMIADLLYIGPQLLVTGWNLLRHGGQARAAEIPTTAWVLWTLLNHPGRVAYGELSSLYADGDLQGAYDSLRRIEGVVFLELGITLTSELRAELGALEYST